MFHLLPVSVLLSIACCFVLHGIWLLKLRRKQYDFITHRWTQLHERAAILGFELSNRASALRNAQEKLRSSASLLSDSEKCFNRLFHSTTLPLSINRIEDGIFQEVNRAFELLAGHTKSELIGRSLSELDRYREPDVAHILAEIRAGKALDRAVFFLPKSDQTQLVLQCTDRIQFDGSDCLILEIRRLTGQA